MKRQFSNFRLESTFPDNTEVTRGNYNKHHWEVYDKTGHLLSIMENINLTLNNVRAFVEGDEDAVKRNIQSYISNTEFYLNRLKNLF